jgi:ABC-type transport system involved in multi-copper enzyme maturation permease subunit
MLGAIVRKELLHHIASFRFWGVAILALVLAASSTAIAARDYNERLHGYREREADQEKRLAAATVYSSLQPPALRPPELLSILDQGFDAQLGTDVTIDIYSIPTQAARAQRGNELLVSMPAVDLTRIVGVVLGLLALLLSYDAFTGERAAGTLRSTFAHSVRRSTVLAGKILGGLLTLALPLTAALLASLGILLLQAATAPTLDQWLRIGGLAASYAAYLSLMLLLGLLLSLHARSSSSALVIAVLFWLVAVLVLPESARALASSLIDTQDARLAAEHAQRSLADDYEQRLAAARRRQPMLMVFSGHTPVSFTSGRHRAVLHRFGSAAYYAELQRFYRFAAETGIRSAEQSDAIARQYDRRLRAGERLGVALSAVSPSFLLDRIAQSFAGTSVAEQDRFLAACRAYRRTFLGYLDRRGAFRSWRWFTDDPPGQLHPWPAFLGLTLDDVNPANVSRLFSRLTDPAVEAQVQRFRQALEKDTSRRLPLGDMPRFSFAGPQFGIAAGQVSLEIAALLTLNALAAALAWLRFRRYEVA